MDVRKNMPALAPENRYAQLISMTNTWLVLAMLGTFATAVWLAFDGYAVAALPLAVVFAGLLRFLIRRSGRRGITPAEIEPPPHDDTR